MTVGAWTICGLIALMAIIVAYFEGTYKGVKTGIATGFIGFVVCIFYITGMLWWFGNTASGSRALKTQQSNFSNGIDRKVTVYDMNGEIVQEYKGKFDIEYDHDRILFDDENGLRHIIYYPTGTVIIDEVKSR